MIRDSFEGLDYHIHTNHSDGVLNPKQIVDRYIERGYRQIAITDHDTISGSWVAYFYSLKKDIEIIPGIEFSTKDNEGREIHILGYGIEYTNRILNEAINQMSAWRDERNRKLFSALNELGYDVTEDEVRRVNGGLFIGKPVIARVLIEKGYVDNIEHAFEEIFKGDDLKHIKTEVYPAKTAIDIIHLSGGLAVWAHPFELREEGESEEEFIPKLYSMLDRMMAWGIDGIECVHPSANADHQEMLAEFAKSNNLVITAGSDFHSDDTRRTYEG